MPSQQRFEGPDLEELLDQVRDRFGPDVAIVEANKIRSGGVGGFFARELFEVIVETDAPDHVPAPFDHAAPATQPLRARTLLDLVDAVDDGPGAGRPDGLASEETVLEMLRRTEGDPIDAEDGVAGLLARVAQARTGAPPSSSDVSGPGGPSMSTDGDAFADVLDRIARSTHAPAAPAASDEPFRSFAETAPPARRTGSAPWPADAPEPVAAGDEPEERPEAGLVRGRRRREAAVEVRPHREVDLGALQRLGLPDTLLHDAPTAGLDRLSALVHLAERFPRPHRLPETGDTVIALVGDRSGMERAVAWVHEQLGLSPERLMLATRSEGRVFPSGRRIGSYEEASAHRRSWRRLPRPVLVVVDEPVGLRGTTWARHVLDALEPSAVWGVVDALRKPEDVVEWGERIGGVDAIALDGTAETSSPASILATGLPVSLLDGHTATPTRWAAVLDERMLAA